MCLAWAAGATVSTAASMVSEILVRPRLSESFPLITRETSSTSSTSFAWTRAFRSITTSPWSISFEEVRPRNNTAQPRMALNGVRSSCETTAKNSSLARLAASASARAASASFQGLRVFDRHRGTVCEVFGKLQIIFRVVSP